MTDAAHPASTSVVLTPRALRVLAHPLRSRLLGALRRDGPATATGLAVALGTNTGATSYHLRRLASVGLVQEEAGGRGRERPWRAAHEMHSWFPSQVADDADARAASDWLQGAGLHHFQEVADAWQAAKADWSPAWRDAAGASDYLLQVTPAQLDALVAAIHELIEGLRPAEPEPGAARVSVFLHAFPDPARPAR